MKPFARGTVVSLLLAAVAAGCGASAFSPHFRDNSLTDLKLALTGVPDRVEPAPRNATGKPVAFVVTDSPPQILAYDLEGRKALWKVEAQIGSRVVVGRTRIFHRGDKDTIVARSVENGQELWKVPLVGGDRLVGMTSDGENLYYVTELVKRSASGIIAYLVGVSGSSGSTMWEESSSGRLGAPTALGRRVFVPLRFQSLAVLDAASGRELARVRSKEETLLWVRRAQNGILYGGKQGVYKLDEKSVAGAQKEATFIAANLPKSVQPTYWWDGYNAALSGYTAYDRNRLLWQAAPEGLTFLDNTIFVHNYRFFFSFDTTVTDPNRSALRWAYSYPRHDVVASDHTGKALLLVTDNGKLIVLDPASGVPVVREDLKVAVKGATFDAGGFAAPASNAKPGTGDLRRALTEVIWDPDRRFGAVKLFCVDELARLAGGEISQDLVKIVTHPDIDRAVYKRAGEVLVARHDKKSIPLYLATLRSRYSFVEGTRGQAVDIMAKALGDLKATEAIKPLLVHLADHETSLPAVEEIVKALSVIGDKTILEPFRDFLLTYRCDPIFTKFPTALNLVAESLLKLGGEDERQLLSFVENDPHTLQSLRTYLGEALRQTAPSPKPKKAAAK